jgi:hydrogenase maturation protein HypF
MDFKKIKLPFRVKQPILALGSQAKNTVCFLENNLALLSPIHQDLNNPTDYLKFEKTVAYFLKKRPKVIAYDLHPGYQSSKYVHRLSPITYRLSPIQHHHAHIASCMIENGLKNQKVIGVAFDGTGLGSDNTLWGAEFLICNYKNFQRKAHLKEIPLLGKEMAILEPWRLAAAWLYSTYKGRFLNLDIGFIKKFDKNKWQVLEKMYLSGFNAPLASSMGRLFDAAASLTLERYKANFEAELAIELEKLAVSCQLTADSYDFKIIKDKEVYILDPMPMFKEIVADLKAKEPKKKIAFRFHLTVAGMIKNLCLNLRRETKINKIVLSGGVFQNKLLLGLSLDLLTQENFNLFTHHNLSCNDSSISLGQAAIANF